MACRFSALGHCPRVFSGLFPSLKGPEPQKPITLSLGVFWLLPTPERPQAHRNLGHCPRVFSGYIVPACFLVSSHP